MEVDGSLRKRDFPFCVFLYFLFFMILHLVKNKILKYIKTYVCLMTKKYAKLRHNLLLKRNRKEEKKKGNLWEREREGRGREKESDFY